MKKITPVIDEKIKIIIKFNSFKFIYLLKKIIKNKLKKVIWLNRTYWPIYGLLKALKVSKKKKFKDKKYKLTKIYIDKFILLKMST